MRQAFSINTQRELHWPCMRSMFGSFCLEGCSLLQMRSEHCGERSRVASCRARQWAVPHFQTTTTTLWQATSCGTCRVAGCDGGHAGPGGLMNILHSTCGICWKHTAGRGMTERQAGSRTDSGGYQKACGSRAYDAGTMSCVGRCHGVVRLFWVLAAHHHVARSLRAWACQLVKDHRLLAYMCIASASSSCSTSPCFAAFVSGGLSDRK
jgi:hypothetical protein